MTAAENREAGWTLADQIRAGLDSSSRAYQETLAEFQKALAISPCQAIESRSAEVVQAYTAREFWQVASMAAEREYADEMAEHIALLLQETDRKLREFFERNSTNLFANAVERSRAEAYLDLIKFTIPVLRRFLDSKK